MVSCDLDLVKPPFSAPVGPGMPRKPSKPANERTPWPQYRSQHRRRSHEEAHAGDAAPIVPQVLEHRLVCDSEVLLVKDHDSLAKLIGELRAAGQFGYDSEFIGEHSYHPALCVIQVATANRVAIIDPLEGLELNPLWELLADAAVQKIVHAGEPDLEPVVRHLGRPPVNIFDTQVAAAFAGLPYPMALGKLLHHVTGLELMSSSRALKFSQWDHRPLSPAQLRYAADDVRYLPLLQHKLEEMLAANRTHEWAEDEVRMLCDPARYTFDAESQRIRVRGVEKLTSRQRALLRNLISWRDATARTHNVPPRSLLRDEVVFELSAAPVQTLQALKQVPGLPRPVVREYAEEILAITARALVEAGEPEDTEARPRVRKMDREQHRERVDAVWEDIRRASVERAIDPGIVTSKRELDRVLRAIEAGQSPTEFRLFTGWRRIFLTPILNALTA